MYRIDNSATLGPISLSQSISLAGLTVGRRAPDYPSLASPGKLGYSATCGPTAPYERLPEHHEAMVLWATVMIMTRQLARHTTGTPPQPPMGR